jgi:hypothetical protein
MAVYPVPEFMDQTGRAQFYWLDCFVFTQFAVTRKMAIRTAMIFLHLLQ